MFLSTSTIFAAPNWTEVQPAGNVGKEWSLLATSSDGETVISGSSVLGRLYLSTNKGVTWNEIQPAGNVDRSWQWATMSLDGQRIFITDFSRLYVSTTRGQSWTEVQPLGNINQAWVSIGMSENGQKLIAANFQSRLYLSSDGGATWTETRPAGNVNYNWYTVSMSGDGQTMFAGGISSRLFVSTNGGFTWSETQPAGNTNQNWLWITTSYDGLTTYAITQNTNKIYKTINRGGTWTETTLSDANPYSSTIWMSSDTQTVFLTGMNGKMYLSTDGGYSWSQDPFVSTVEFGWVTGTMSRDGTHFYAGEWLGRLYHGILTKSSPPAPTTTPASTPSCTDTAPTGTVDLFQINRKQQDAQLFFTPAHNANRYNVMYGYQQGDERFGALSQQVANDTGVQSVSIHGLDPKMSYWFKVVPINGCATGSWSNWMKAGSSKNKKIFYRN